jgi:ADP-ribosylglycohydrolase
MFDKNVSSIILDYLKPHPILLEMKNRNSQKKYFYDTIVFTLCVQNEEDLTDKTPLACQLIHHLLCEEEGLNRQIQTCKRYSNWYSYEP